MTDFIVESLDDTLYSLVELCACCHLEEGFVVTCIEHGVVEVNGPLSAQWRFSNRARLRLQKAWRLHRDLDVQPAALPLVLQLLGELDALRQENRGLYLRLRHWEDGL
ncbi:MAG: chaperone modulator CbpM [Pseudomonadales bacterium]|jgi:chaperone modulatory protein CbpM|nr:chaperone modulator CbpM [Pseudomonadales bacterium]